MSTSRIQAAPGQHGCCDAAGRMVGFARMPIDRDRLIALAHARGDGSREEIAQRIEDMLAAGMLIELDDEVAT